MWTLWLFYGTSSFLISNTGQMLWSSWVCGICDRQFKNQLITWCLKLAHSSFIDQTNSDGDKPARLWWRRSHPGVTLVLGQRTDISQSPGERSRCQLRLSVEYQQELCSQCRHVCGGLQGAGWQNCSWQPCLRWHQVCQQNLLKSHWPIYQELSALAVEVQLSMLSNGLLRELKRKTCIWGKLGKT